MLPLPVMHANKKAEIGQRSFQERLQTTRCSDSKYYIVPIRSITMEIASFCLLVLAYLI